MEYTTNRSAAGRWTACLPSLDRGPPPHGWKWVDRLRQFHLDLLANLDQNPAYDQSGNLLEIDLPLLGC